MISGMLPNNTIWWLSTNGQKIWIESKDLEQDKFKEKGYSVKSDIISYTGKPVGELTTSRLESRKRKDAWILKVESVLDIYPELVEEIKQKEIENKKKKKDAASKNRKCAVPKPFIIKEEPKREFAKTNNVPSENIEIKNADTFKYVNISKDANISKDVIIHSDTFKDEKPKIDTFDVNSPYVSLIKDEVEKSADGVTMTFPAIKAKMGGEFLNMHDLRIFYGLQKILSDVGIKVEQGYKERRHAVIMKKMQ